MKFLVIWEIDIAMLKPEIVKMVMKMPEYAKKLHVTKKLSARYHIIGKHGGAWIYDVDSNEELERFLALSPVYNFSRYTIYALAEMETPAEIIQPLE